MKTFYKSHATEKKSLLMIDLESFDLWPHILHSSSYIMPWGVGQVWLECVRPRSDISVHGIHPCCSDLDQYLEQRYTDITIFMWGFSGRCLKHVDLLDCVEDLSRFIIISVIITTLEQ